MLDSNNLRELAQATSIKLNLSQFAVEKDFYLTKAIQALSQVDDDFFELVFQGGTSLSKGYQVIRRLSEDADFRIIQKQIGVTLGKDAWRKKLRNFRYNLVKALKNVGFKIEPESIRVFYEGRYMSIHAQFAAPQKPVYLKPYLAIDCFAGELVLRPFSRPITTLIKSTLRDKCEHGCFLMDCVALDETAAEKWVALTRRVSNSKLKSRQSDKHLVRHCYDLYQLSNSGLLTGEYIGIVQGIMKKDAQRFKEHNSAYSDNPLFESKLALNNLMSDSQWRDHWNYFLAQMVYDNNKPSFEDAIHHVQQISQNIFTEIERS